MENEKELINPIAKLYDDLRIILKHIVTKKNADAAKMETLDMTKNGDRYIAARLHRDTFFSHLNYDEDVIIKTGITDPTLIEYYHEERRNVPDKYHDTMLQLQRDKIITNYDEPNNYYRMLNGLPDVGDTDYVYVDDDLCDKYDVPKGVPIHKLDSIYISTLEVLGIMDTIKEKYPNKKYLGFLGTNSIDIVTSRSARNFELIRLPELNTGITSATLDMFRIVYAQCREYFMSVIYNPEYVNIHSYYDNFIGLCIFVMTIQQMMSRTTETTITRDFFDEYCMECLFDMYNVPYLHYLDMENKKSLCQNLNILIQLKGTDEVFYDIANILGQDRIGIYKYLLVKTQKYDEFDRPIKKKKWIRDEFGDNKEVDDREAGDDIHFVKVDIGKSDMTPDIIEPNNEVPYEEVTEKDPFWYEDDDVKDKIYDDEYNYVESKYLGVTVAYKLSEIMFETVYLIRMLTDKKDELNEIHMYLPKILGSKEITIFECVIGLSTMLCWKYYLTGEILYNPSQILHVLGFNFFQDFTVIRREIQESKYLSNEVLTYIQNLSVVTVENVNNLYLNIIGLRDFIQDRLSQTQNIEEYRAYEKLYRTLYIYEQQRFSFDMRDETSGDTKPKFANTYFEFLKHLDYEFYDFIMKTSRVEISQYIEHAINQLSKLVPYLSSMHLMNDTNNHTVKALIKLIDFFRSYTTDLIGLNVIYVFDTKALNMLKLIDTETGSNKSIEINDLWKLDHSDTASIYSSIITPDVFRTRDANHIYKKYIIDHNIKLKDDCKWLSTIGIDVNFDMYDINDIVKTIIYNDTNMSYEDKIDTLSAVDVITNDDMSFNDTIKISTSFAIESKTFKFIPSDWVQVNGEYIISINRDEHQFGDDVTTKLYILDEKQNKHISVGYLDVSISVNIGKTGDIIIESIEPYDILVEVIDLSN